MGLPLTTSTRRAALITVAALAIFGPNLLHWISLSVAQRRLDHRLAELDVQQERLRALERRLEEDPAYVEGLIRATFKVAKPGEYVIPLVASPAPAASLRGGASR